MPKQSEAHSCSIRKKGVGAFAIVLILLVFASRSPARQVEVVYVYDGDTVKVADGKTEYRVRLMGIDAPETGKGKGESGQPYSQKARSHLKQLVLHRHVEIQEYGTDVYNRILGVIWLDGKDINVEMVRSGLAEADCAREGQNPDMKPYRDAQEEAVTAGRGMWSLGEKYVSPSQWRRDHR